MAQISWSAAMNPALTTQELEKKVTQELTASFKLSGHRLRMIGLVFATPDTPLVQAEILPRIGKYHSRSGRHIEFYFAGYAQGGRPKESDVILVRGPKGTWYFSHKAFDRFRRDIQSQTTWQHSGDSDLLLSNGYLEEHKSRGTIDFKSTIVCQLEAMKKDEAFVSVGQFFERIFQFAESYDGDNPTWGFSDQEGLTVLGSGLKRVVMSLLPKTVIQDARKAEHLAVLDVARR